MEHDVQRLDDHGKPLGNVDPALSKDNWVLDPTCDTTAALVRKFNDFFKDSVEALNRKNRKKHPDRICVPEKYYEKCCNRKLKTKKNQPQQYNLPLREYVFSVGSQDNPPPTPEIAKESLLDWLLSDFMGDPRYNQFIVMQACLHMDEATPHLHVVMCPVAMVDGLPYPELAAACEHAGAGKHQDFSDYVAHQTKNRQQGGGDPAILPLEQVQDAWKDAITDRCRAHGWDVDYCARSGTVGIRHKSVSAYRHQKAKELEESRDKLASECEGLETRKTSLQADNSVLQAENTRLQAENIALAQREQAVKDREKEQDKKARALVEEKADLDNREADLDSQKMALKTKKTKFKTDINNVIGQVNNNTKKAKEKDRAATDLAARLLPVAAQPVVPWSALQPIIRDYQHQLGAHGLARVESAMVDPDPALVALAEELAIPLPDLVDSPEYAAMIQAAVDIAKEDPDLENDLEKIHL